MYGYDERNKINGSEASKSALKNAYKGTIKGILEKNDYSNGAYYWDGTDYSSIARYKEGTTFSSPEHNIFQLKENKKPGSTVYGSYSSKFETTHAIGNTIFSKLTNEWRAVQHRTKIANWYGKVK